MRTTVRSSCALVVALCALVVGPARARAQVCGDVDGNGSVTVSDGVQSLRAAAGLGSDCTLTLCDLNVDGTITVSDAVLSLRLAASLNAAVSCLQEQKDLAIERAEGTISIGLGEIPQAGSQGVPAGTPQTQPCPDGGSINSVNNGFAYDACRQGGVESNGFVSTTVTGNAIERSFTNFSQLRLSTGETLISSGSLSFVSDGSTLFVEGSVSHTSAVLGTFTSRFVEVQAGRESGHIVIVGGEIFITVRDGLGAFANLRSFDVDVIATGLTIVVAAYAGGGEEIAVIAENIGLCDPCASDTECNAALDCRPCAQNCRAGAGSRCTVDFDAIEEFEGRGLVVTCPDGSY